MQKNNLPDIRIQRDIYRIFYKQDYKDVTKQ